MTVHGPEVTLPFSTPGTTDATVTPSEPLRAEMWRNEDLCTSDRGCMHDLESWKSQYIYIYIYIYIYC